MNFKQMTRLVAAATTVMVALAGCGGSGAGAGGPGLNGSASGTDPGTIVVGSTSPTIGSDGGTPIDISATVKDLNNVGVADMPVIFSTTDSGSILIVRSNKTDETGTATATLKITDATARDIAVKAVTGTVEGSISVRVTGTSLTLSGQTIMALNGKSPFVVSVRNASNVGVAGVPVTLRSRSGNLITESSPGSSRTDSAGQAKFSVEGRMPGQDVLTATGLGVTQTSEVSISGDVASFEAPAPAAEVVVNGTSPVAVRFLAGGVPLANSSVQLSATRGTLAATTGLTDSEGYFRTTIASAQAGLGTISAVTGDGTATSVDFEFVSRTPAAMDLQASPTTVPANPTGSSGNASELIAKVRDVAGNPVKGVRVDFSAVVDPSGGSISPAFSLTNSAGIASTAFIAGPNPSGQNAIQISASIPGTTVQASQPALLTTVADALAVRMNTGNTIESSDNTTYELPYAVVVSDAAGNPVQGAKVTVSYKPVAFTKGWYVEQGAAWRILPANSVICPSEDLNQNGVLDAGEDADGDGVLEPSNVATAFIDADGGKTDASGFAYVRVKYPRGFANWVAIEVQVTITATSGTEVRTARRITLPAVLTDLATATNPPGGQVQSPYGVALVPATLDANGVPEACKIPN